MRERARTALGRLPCYDAAPEDLVAVIEHGGLTRRHEGRRFKVERRVGSVHLDRCGKRDAAIPQDDTRGESGCRRLTRHEAHVRERVALPCDLGTSTHDCRAPLDVEVQHVQTLACRDPYPGSLPDGERPDARMGPHDRAVGPLDRTGNERLRSAIAHEVAVVAGSETDVHAFGLCRGGEAKTRRDRSRLGLVTKLAYGELDPHELPLAEHVERVGLVLRSIARAEQMTAPVIAGRDPGVVPGRESITTELADDVVEERIELDVLVARHARIWRLPAGVGVHETIDDPLAEDLRVVERIERNTEGGGSAA